jgi:transcriptional regulator with XRE-family HTH domain
LHIWFCPTRKPTLRKTQRVKFFHRSINGLKHLGQKIRELREKQNLLLRQVAAHLEVDTALMSKIERGDRNASKQQVIEIAKFLKANEDELLTLWLADKLENVVGDEKDLAPDALNILKKKLKK